VQAQQVRQGDFDVSQARTMSQSEEDLGSGTGGNLKNVCSRKEGTADEEGVTRE